MKEKIGTFFIVCGVLGLMFFGFHYVEGTDSFKTFGENFTLHANELYMVFLSAILMILGVLISRLNIRSSLF